MHMHKKNKQEHNETTNIECRLHVQVLKSAAAYGLHGAFLAQLKCTSCQRPLQ